MAQPRVLLIAPLSGHFATLLRGTVRTMLADHDVFITDWRNARDVPLLYGRFGMDEYIAHLIAWLQAIGPGAHAMAVCQPCVPALAAAAVMAQDGDPAQPRSLTLMAGPVDARVNPSGGQRHGHVPAAVVVRAQRDRHRAVAPSRRDAPRLSGVRPARRVPGA